MIISHLAEVHMIFCRGRFINNYPNPSRIVFTGF